MKKLSRILAAASILAALAMPQAVKAVGWPANYQGVMLQGFYWDSYSDTKWTVLESKVDEYSTYFKLIWIPNSGYCGGGNNMGYMPQYWFTNHRSSFGTEEQLLSMIQAYKAKGTGFIADCVINHRNGTTNWTNFPKEQWNGQTWEIGLDGICRNDEVNNPGNPGGATGNYDTGDNFDGARDLDHTNTNVQNNCKNYVKCLHEKYGYTGVRYDMVKGYSGQYTKMYNQYANVKFSVGEYWDGYDAIAAWINSTGKTSAAFDFPFKYALNEAFGSGDMTKLVWYAGNTQQPAGLIHFDYRPLAVTFIDNHDTYRDDSKFTGNVVAANAFMLFSPGTPCVFLPHYKNHKAEIQKLIKLRNDCGIHSGSEVRVLQSSRDCYMAEITGTVAKAVVKIGSAQVSPPGYSNSDIKASGTDYCVWTKAGGTPGPDPDPDPDPITGVPDQLYLMGNLQQGSWKTNVGINMTKSGKKFTATGVKLVADPGETKAFFTFVTALGTTGDSSEWDEVINGSDRYGAQTKDEILTSSASIRRFAEGVDASSAYSWGVTPGTYTITADFETMKVSLGNGGSTPDPGPDPDPTLPSHLYVIGEVNGNGWAPDAVVEMEKSGNEFVKVLEVTPGTGASNGYFSFCLNPAGDWASLNAVGNRYAPAADTELIMGGASASFEECADGNLAKAFYAGAGKYKLVVDWANKKARLENPNGSSVEEFTIEDAQVRWFNLQGLEIEQPTTPGIYIRLTNQKAQKTMVR